MNCSHPSDQGFFEGLEQIPLFQETGRARAGGFLLDLGIA